MNKKKTTYNKKLTPKQIRKIREEYLDGYSQVSIAEYYDVSKKLIYDIIHLNKYKDVDLHLPIETYLEAVHERSFTKRSK